jgi:hypothetical protein
MNRTLEEKQAEKQRLSKAYKAHKRAEWGDLLRREPRLILFKRAVRKADTPSRVLMILADSWVRFADNDTRFAALRIIDAHANRMALRAGGQTLSDPIIGRNLFMIAREMLAVR